MSSGNNDKPQYDPSRLIFAPNVKREPSSTTPSASSSQPRLGSFRQNIAGSSGPRRFAPVVGAGNTTSSGGPRRFAPKISGASVRRKAPVITSKHVSDAEGFDLMNTDLMDDVSGRPPRQQRDRDQRDRKQQPRKRRENIVHMSNAGGVFTDRKPLQAQPDVMEVDSSSDEDEKVKKQYEKTPAQMHTEYFEGVVNPPLKLHVDEDDTDADEQFFASFNTMLREDELFFIQLPSHLPMKDKKSADASSGATKKQQSVDDEYENIWNQEFENSLIHLPEGQIGTLKVYKSGKAKLELKSRDGPSILLDVTRAQDHGFCEDLAAIDQEKKKCYNLGSVTKRITCIPDCETLLKDVNREG